MTALSDETTRRLRLTGRVQGVWFRGWTVKAARSRGLRGWVRNRHDGSVEIFLCGPADSVEEMIAAARIGPPAARVDTVQCEAAGIVDDDVTGGFSQRPNA